MSNRKDLEDALHVRSDDKETLEVYADLLQAEGDPRGELITLDTLPPSESFNDRRGQLIRRWVGDFDVQFDAEEQLWYVGSLAGSYATFDGGFMGLYITEEDYSADLAVLKLLDTPAAEYLCDLRTAGSTMMLQQLLDKLVAKKRAWLQWLGIGRYQHLRPLLVARDLGDALVAAAPNLKMLDLWGRNLFGEWSHPNVCELAVVGAEAIELAAGPPMFAVSTIRYTFDEDRPTPPGLFSPIRFPVVRRLDFSQVESLDRLFPALASLGIASQITNLVLPPIPDADQPLLRAATDRMPLLCELVIGPD